MFCGPEDKVAPNLERRECWLVSTADALIEVCACPVFAVAAKSLAQFLPPETWARVRGQAMRLTFFDRGITAIPLSPKLDFLGSIALISARP